MSGYDRAKIVGMTEQDLDEFTCGICQEIFNTPMVTQCCRQTYCKACIGDWLNTQNTCPNDRKPLHQNELIQAPRLVLNLLSNIRVKCDYYEKGCEVITTISDLSKHIEICEYKPEINCRTCGFMKIEDQEHNCINNLLNKNKSIEEELNKLYSEITQLKRSNQSLTLGMSAVLVSARNYVNAFVLIDQINIDRTIIQFLIDQCKISIMNYNSYRDICVYLTQHVNIPDLCLRSKYWHAVAYSSDGGESSLIADQFFSIRFDKLVIELFTPLQFGQQVGQIVDQIRFGS